MINSENIFSTGEVNDTAIACALNNGGTFESDEFAITATDGTYRAVTKDDTVYNGSYLLKRFQLECTYQSGTPLIKLFDSLD